MKISIRRLFSQNGNETGANLSVVFGGPTNIEQKEQIESNLIQFAFEVLYPGEILNIYKEINEDTPSITVIKNINNLPDELFNNS